MTRPRLLDLFCCQGGAGAGYARAGFDVVGVDVVAQRHYPHPFVLADALDYVATHAAGFDAVHASPPCQAYSITRHTHDRVHPDLLAPTRAALQATGLPYVIENVPGAPMVNPLTLCGSQFGLTAIDTDGTPLVLRRHRLFESNVMLLAPGPCRHDAYPGHVVAGAYSGGSEDLRHAREVRHGGYTPAKEVRGALLGINWMTLHGLSQSLPPAYTAYLGEQLRAFV